MNPENNNLSGVKRRVQIFSHFLRKNNSNEQIKEVTLEKIISLINDTSRTIKENKIIVDYLSNISDFKNLMKSKSDDFLELMTNISIVISYEKYFKNTIIFRTGEIGDKFFLILSGKVVVLLPRDEYHDLTEEEYYIYLLRLRKYEEYELLNRCIINNKNIVASNNFQDFDKWLLKQQDLNRKRSVSYYQSDLAEEINKTLKCIIQDDDFGKNIFARRFSKNTAVFDNNHFVNKLNVDEYINRIRPIKTNKNDIRHKFFVYLYYPVLTLETGSHFGDLALITESGKRTATVMAIEECHFGVLDKEAFDNSLRYAKEKEVKNKLNLLSSISVFSWFSKDVFKKKYLNLFISVNSSRGYKLMKEGDISEKVFVVKEGIFQVNCKKSLIELNQLIIKLGGKVDTDNELDYMIEDHNFHNYMNEKKLFKIANISNIDILGMNDMIIDNKYIFTVETSSIKGEYFFIDKKFFITIVNHESIKDKTEKFLTQKKNFLIERLLALKKLNIKLFKEQGKKNYKEAKSKDFDKYLTNIIDCKPSLLETNFSNFKNMTVNFKNSVLQRNVSKLSIKNSLSPSKNKIELKPIIARNKSSKFIKIGDSIDDSLKYTRVKTEESDLLLHRISKKKSSNIVDFLAMDSINRNNYYSSIDDKSNTRYDSIEFTQKKLKTISSIEKNKSMKKMYYSNIVKMKFKNFKIVSK